MVRRGSRRSSVKEASPTDSPTQTAMGSAKARRGTSPLRTRGLSPSNRGTREGSLMRPRRSKRNNDNNNYMAASPWTDSVENSFNASHSSNLPQDSTLQMIPTHWTSESGKFDPKQSAFGFDARSNAAIQGPVRRARNQKHSDDKSLSNGSEDTNPSNTSEETQEKNGKSKKKKKDKNALLEGEIEDPIERHQFYKKLKKAGIKKTFAVQDDWETSSQCSDVSEISVGNASYILDLAQQKDSRKQDREEEALEEALELYGTWLTEGKNDDKNIFLMILHEVKKEHKAKYKKADKRHAALLDAALDEELQRRERVKREEIARIEEELRQKAEAEKREAERIAEEESVSEHDSPTITSPSGRRKRISGSNHLRNPNSRSPNSRSSDSGSNHLRSPTSRSAHSLSGHSRSGRKQKSFYTKQRESNISEIITKQKSFGDNGADDKDEKDSCDSNDSFDESHDSFDESHDSFDQALSKHFDSAESIDNENDDEFEDVFDEEPPKPSSLRVSRHSNHSQSNHSRSRGLFGFGSKTNGTKPPRIPSSGQDSRGLFGRLRRQLSERQTEQSKQHEKSWRDYSQSVTAEEKWWKKINDAKHENVLFDQQKALLDMTTNTAPKERPSSMAQLDFSTRTDPKNNGSSNFNPNGSPGSLVPTFKNTNSDQDDKKATSTTASTNTTSSSSPEISPKKKKSSKDPEIMEVSKELTPDKKKKKKKQDRRRSETGGLSSSNDSLFDAKKSSKSKHDKRSFETGRSESALDATKSPKPKDKKKKKKSKSLDSNEEYSDGFVGLNDMEEKKPKKKKKEKSPKNGTRTDRSLDSIDEWDTRSMDAKSGKKKKSKESTNRSSIEMSPRRKSRIKSIDKSDTISIKLGKKKKKKSTSIFDSFSDDAIYSDNNSVDCIIPSPSEDTRGSTVVTMESRA